jgi:hypothetical protein
MHLSVATNFDDGLLEQVKGSTVGPRWPFRNAGDASVRLGLHHRSRTVCVLDGSKVI